MSTMPLPSSPELLASRIPPPEFPTDDMYERMCQIGQGTFGSGTIPPSPFPATDIPLPRVVYKARAPDGSLVALKAVRVDDQRHGFSVTSVREIQILQSLCHENIISITDVVASKDAHLDRANAHIYVVFPYLEHDLSGLLDNPACRITPSVIKCYFKQIVTAVAYLHSNQYLHRDVKCSNILINNEGIVKLADFGLARPFRLDGEPYTDKVCTLWYRAPALSGFVSQLCSIELLFGEKNYGPPLDVWSLGCVFGEMLTQRPLFHGATELDQIDRIFRLCGTPTALPTTGAVAVPATHYPRQVKRSFVKYGLQESDLMDKILEMDPSKRITADGILRHPYFTSSPIALLPEQVPKFDPSNELSAAKRKGLPLRSRPGSDKPTTIPASLGKRQRSSSPSKAQSNSKRHSYTHRRSASPRNGKANGDHSHRHHHYRDRNDSSTHRTFRSSTDASGERRNR